MRVLLSAVLVSFPILAAASTTPAATVAALWQASSHAPGAVPDAERLQKLFRSDTVVVGGIYRDGKPLFHTMKAQEFIAAQSKPKPHGFYECEVAREVREYDRFATVYSVVETRRDSTSAKADYTGVNSIQLYRDEEGWKIVSVYYHIEKPGMPIPLGGGKSGVCLGA
jgi:hypothetical protein